MARKQSRSSGAGASADTDGPDGQVDDRVPGYFASGTAFAAITALWAYVVRGDEFYAMQNLFGVELPTTTISFLTTMPILGFIVGRFRFDANAREGFFDWLGRAFARLINFCYSHILIVLFTAAMASEAFIGWNLDNAVEAIDNQLFDLASRYAPWLAAYLGGFNFGRATSLSREAKRRARDLIADLDDRTLAVDNDRSLDRRGSPERVSRVHRQDPPISDDEGIPTDTGPSFFSASTRRAIARKSGKADVVSNASERSSGGFKREPEPMTLRPENRWRRGQKKPPQNQTDVLTLDDDDIAPRTEKRNPPMRRPARAPSFDRLR